jgi:hypothetical protein
MDPTVDIDSIECPGCRFFERTKGATCVIAIAVYHTCEEHKHRNPPDSYEKKWICDVCKKTTDNVKGTWLACRAKNLDVCSMCCKNPLPEEFRDVVEWEHVNRDPIVKV